jgi:hypothetical protein
MILDDTKLRISSTIFLILLLFRLYEIGYSLALRCLGEFCSRTININPSHTQISPQNIITNGSNVERLVLQDWGLWRSSRQTCHTAVREDLRLTAGVEESN